MKASIENNSREEVQANVANAPEFGEIKIHENVIASIVRKVALKQSGVARLAGNNFVDTLGEIVGSRRIQDRAIIVKFLDNGDLDLEIKIVIKYGFNLPKVANAVQKSVIAEVENITGINVFKINVTIQDVEEEEEDNLEEADTAAIMAKLDK